MMNFTNIGASKEIFPDDIRLNVLRTWLEIEGDLYEEEAKPPLFIFCVETSLSIDLFFDNGSVDYIEIGRLRDCLEAWAKEEDEAGYVKKFKIIPTVKELSSFPG